VPYLGEFNYYNMKNLLFHICAFTCAVLPLSLQAQSGSSLNFDGVDDYISTPITFDLGENWTYECWVKSPIAPGYTEYNGPMYGVNTGIIWDHAYAEFRGAATVQAADEEFYTATYDTLEIDTWYHLAATYDGTVLRAFKNGVLIDSAITSGGITSQPGTLSLGKHPTVSNFWIGTMDEVRIWTTARTCEQINQYMNTELVGNEPGLYAYYRFNEGTPAGANTSVTVLNDLTPDALNDGTLNNFALTGTFSNFDLGAPFNAPLNCGVTAELNEVHNNSNVNIYPNPIVDYFRIETSAPTSAQISSLNGAILGEIHLDNEATIDVSNYAPGVYFIRTAEGQTVKFIKE
jgi:hypothetical protein